MSYKYAAKGGFSEALKRDGIIGKAWPKRADGAIERASLANWPTNGPSQVDDLVHKRLVLDEVASVLQKQISPAWVVVSDTNGTAESLVHLERNKSVNANLSLDWY